MFNKSLNILHFVLIYDDKLKKEEPFNVVRIKKKSPDFKSRTFTPGSTLSSGFKQDVIECTN